MTSARYIIGDVFERMAELPDGSVDLVMCSPPFLALRSYLPADHPDKAKEIGAERTPAAFVDTLLRLSSEWRRILAPHGSIVVELGDTYSGSGGGGGDYDIGGLRDGQERFAGAALAERKAHQDIRNAKRKVAVRDGVPSGSYGTRPGAEGAAGRARDDFANGWPLAKSLCLIPELYRIGLVYGINPLTGTPSPAGRWRARNVVRWHRPNPPVGALGDKFRPATSDMVIACVSGSRYFDLDAVRDASKNAIGVGVRPTNARVNGADERDSRATLGPFTADMQSAGAPPLDTWIIPTEPFKGSHYATWPRELCVKPIAAMCPQHVCLTCGKPRTRIVGEPEYISNNKGNSGGHREGANSGTGAGLMEHKTRVAHTIGWTDCGHDNYRRGLVLDPFAGSGTTLAVATGMGRDAIGIDIDARNQWLARERIGLFLTTFELGEALA